MIILHRQIAFVTTNCVGIDVNNQMMGISVARGVCWERFSALSAQKEALPFSF